MVAIVIADAWDSIGVAGILLVGGYEIKNLILQSHLDSWPSSSGGQVSCLNPVRVEKGNNLQQGHTYYRWKKENYYLDFLTLYR